MLNCEYCNYYTDEKERIEAEGSCRFCGYHFQTGDFISDMEYPCGNLSYEDYLNRQTILQPYKVINNENWRVEYRLKHPVRRKEKIANAG